MVTGDGAYIKKINRSLILKKILEHGLISRADLSKITGLNKATISVQISDLLDEELICETQQEHHSVGRRPIMLSINNKAGYVLGIDLDYHQIQYSVANLQGTTIQYDVVPLIDNNDYHTIVQLLIEHIKQYADDYSDSHYGLTTVMIGVHGTVNQDESLQFIPAYGWHHKALKDDLEQALTIPVFIENNANLSAYAEKVYQHHQSNNLLNILLSSGIGAGIMIDGTLHKGYHGYAGEMGHMIILPDGKACRCGNHGCWELYASEKSFFNQLSKDLERPDLNLEDIRTLIEQNDPVTIRHMDEFVKHISIGLNNVINLYNPETLVLNSNILNQQPNVIDKIENHLISSVSQYRKIVLSELGETACVLGACALSVQRFLEVSDLVLNVNENDLILPASG